MSFKYLKLYLKVFQKTRLYITAYSVSERLFKRKVHVSRSLSS